jgi:hypothetical protein
VVWLDELQRYLDGANGLTGGTIRILLNAPGPLILVGTLWPDRHSSYTGLPAVGEDDPHARERAVLDLADVVRVGEEFSAAERARAHAAGEHDRQIAAALTDDRRLAQALAAAPELLACWDNAKVAKPYAWAVITAALDAVCLGVQTPLGRDLLRAAAPGYCTSRQQALAPTGWFDHAIVYATKPLRGAAAALDPVAAGMGRVAGYTPADYLVQHATRGRGNAIIPASTWGALTAATFDLADTWRLAQSAERLQLLAYAVPLYRRLHDAGDPAAADRLFQVAADRGDLDSLRALADAGDEKAQLWLVTVVAGADPEGVVGRLVDEGNVDALRKLAVGNSYAAERLAFLLAERGEIADLARVLKGRADYGDRDANALLIALLLEHREFDRLRALAADGFGHGWAVTGLVNRLVQLGDLDRLSVLSRDGYRYATEQLANQLHNRGDRDGLRQLALTADYDDPEWLASLLQDLGDLDGAAELRRTNELHSLAGYGDSEAIEQLANLLKNRGDRVGLHKLALNLRKLVSKVDDDELEWLAALLEGIGDLEGAADVRWTKDRRRSRLRGD